MEETKTESINKDIPFEAALVHMAQTNKNWFLTINLFIALLDLEHETNKDLKVKLYLRVKFVTDDGEERTVLFRNTAGRDAYLLSVEGSRYTNVGQSWSFALPAACRRLIPNWFEVMPEEAVYTVNKTDMANIVETAISINSCIHALPVYGRCEGENWAEHWNKHYAKDANLYYTRETVSHNGPVTSLPSLSAMDFWNVMSAEQMVCDKDMS